MNDEIKEENKQIQPIKKKRGRPKKYNKITPIINLNIEKDLFLFIPYCEEKNKEIDNFQLELEEILNVKNKTDEERINDINEIDKLKNIIKDQIVIIDKYKHKYNDIKIYTDKIRSITIDCPFELNKDKTIIIDEPEIHLHRSIMNRLWTAIENERDDCLFIYITHDTQFAASHSQAKKIWIKN